MSRIWTLFKKDLKKNKGVYLYYFNIKEYRDQANSQEATKKKNLDITKWEKTWFFMDTYFKISDQWEICRSIYFLDEDYYSLPSKNKRKETGLYW